MVFKLSCRQGSSSGDRPPRHNTRKRDSIFLVEYRYALGNGEHSHEVFSLCSICNISSWRCGGNRSLIHHTVRIRDIKVAGVCQDAASDYWRSLFGGMFANNQADRSEIYARNKFAGRLFLPFSIDRLVFLCGVIGEYSSTEGRVYTVDLFLDDRLFPGICPLQQNITLSLLSFHPLLFWKNYGISRNLPDAKKCET